MNLNLYTVTNKEYMRYHGHFFKKFVDMVWAEDMGHVHHDDKPGDSVRSKFGVPIMCTEMYIENADTGEFVVAAFSNQINRTLGQISRNPKMRKVYMAHFNYERIIEQLKREKKVNRLDCYQPWFFPMSDDLDFEAMRRARKRIPKNKIINKMHFRGSGLGSHRKTINEIQKYSEFAGGKGVDPKEFYPELLHHKMAMSFYIDYDLDWYGEFCYRDTEFMALEIPFIRIEYRNTCQEALIPNKHYISINRELALDAYKKGGHDGLAKLHIDRFNQVKDDDEYLAWVARNARQYYERNCMWPNSGKALINRIKRDLRNG